MPTPRKYGNNAERQAAYRARRASCTDKTQAPVTPGYRRWEGMIRDSRCLLDSVNHEMESYYEERSERWQESDRGERLTEMMESIEEITTMMHDLACRA